MGCCGKKASGIIKGFGALMLGRKYEFTDSRILKCQTCDYNTWLSATEYALWLTANGISVIINFRQLEKLPMLTRYSQSRKRRRLYCRICKCSVPAKARVKSEICPKDEWSK